jgi:hypothetical protein
MIWCTKEIIYSFPRRGEFPRGIIGHWYEIYPSAEMGREYVTSTTSGVTLGGKNKKSYLEGHCHCRIKAE